jgi:heparanase
MFTLGLEMRFILIGGCSLAALSFPANASGGDNIALSPSELVAVGKVDERFQSYNVEMAEIVGGRFWAPYAQGEFDRKAPGNNETLGFDSSLFRERPPADLRNVRLRNLAKALGPVYIRVSGSWANKTYFQDDNLARMTTPPPGFENVLTRDQWAGLIDFADAVDGRITTSFAVSDGARDPAGVWSPDEARGTDQ